MFFFLLRWVGFFRVFFSILSRVHGAQQITKSRHADGNHVAVDEVSVSAFLLRDGVQILQGADILALIQPF